MDRLVDPPPERRLDVLRGVNLEVGEGEVLGLLGPNGAGKTTLVEILTTLLLPSGGEAWIEGYEVTRHPAEVRMRVGYCPSANQSFFPRLTGTQNLEFFAVFNDYGFSAARRKIAELMRLVELDPANPASFQCYSDGMRQRLSLARALLSDPPVLLLDEPTRSLDPMMQTEIRTFLRRRLAGELGKTVLLITHSIEEAEQVCDRVAVLNSGRIVWQGSRAELRTSLQRGGLDVMFQKTAGAAS